MANEEVKKQRKENHIRKTKVTSLVKTVVTEKVSAKTVSTTIVIVQVKKEKQDYLLTA